MHNKVIDGKMHAMQLLESLREEVVELKAKGVTPGFAVVLANEDPASQVYVKNKQKAAQQLGIHCEIIKLPQTISMEGLIAEIDRLNLDASFHGIIVQLPLPSSIDVVQVLNRVAPAKDIDGFGCVNVGKLSMGDKSGFIPCTPLGTMRLLKKYEPDLTGKLAVVIGRSNIVGKPMSALLLQENCTVIMCHSKTKDLKAITQQADIVVSAIGKPLMLTEEYFKEGAIILDVGINRIDDGGKVKLVGDVDFTSVHPKCRYITPVPGGIGPMTVASLMQNTIIAARQHQQ